MLFSSLTDPSNIAVFLVEAALFGLALAAARGRLVRQLRWLARGMAAVTLVIGVAFAAGMILEVLTVRLPFSRPEAPLGTYAEMTQLGLLVGAVHLGLVAIGSAVAFRRPGLGGLILAIDGLYGVLDSLPSLAQDPTLPVASFIVGLQLTLFILAVAALLLGTWRAAHRRAATPGQPSVSIPHTFAVGS